MEDQKMDERERSYQDDDRSFTNDLAGKYLTFELGEEFYGVPISPIDDIIELKDYTEVPQTADYVKGVINLRGSVIPIIDLRQRFSMEEREYDRETCIIVVQMQGVSTGLIVDRVEEVRDLGDEEIEPAPRMGNQVETRFIAGMGKTEGEDQVVILLELDKILSDEEIEQLEEASESTPEPAS